MAGSVNKVIIIGNLGRDPETRSTQNGDKVVSMSVATSERWKDKQSGEDREKTEWHRVVIFDQHLADVAGKYLKKGAKVYLEGQVQTRKWTTDNGEERYVTEIVLPRFGSTLTMLGSAGSGNNPPPADSMDNYTNDREIGQVSNVAPDFDDDIPF